MSDPTKVDKWLYLIKNNLFFAIIIIVCTIIMGIWGFLKVVSEIKKAILPDKETKISPQSIIEPYSFVLISRQKSTAFPIAQGVVNGKNDAPIVVHPISAPHDLKDVPMPLVFNVPLSKGQVLFNLQYRNFGDQTEEKIRISLSFGETHPIRIDKIVIEHEQRLKIIEGGHGASFVTFYIEESLPKETQSAQIFVSTDELPTVTFWTSQMHESKEIFIYDCIF